MHERHADGLARHFERCSDYFELVFGHPPGPAERQSTFIALPEGKTYDDKFTFVMVFGNDVVGDLDLIRDHPQTGEWWVGSLLLDPSVRGMGLGTDLITAFSEWIASLGGSALRCAEAAQNHEGVHFWQRLGFVEIERRRNERMGVLSNEVIVLRRALRPSS